MEISKSYPLFDVKNQKISMNFHTLHLLRQVKVQYFTPIAIVGNLLTGKSTLFNELSRQPQQKQQTQQIFKTSAKTNPQTKGANIALVNLNSQTRCQPFLLIDFQGFGRTDCNYEIQLKLLTLACTISKHIIFNTFGALDTSIFSQILQTQEQLPRDITKPNILFLQRDFSLQMKNQQGQQVKPQQYLKAFLNQLSQQQAGKIKSSFNNLDCFIMSNPCEKLSFQKTLVDLKDHFLQSAVLKSAKNDKHSFLLRLEALARILQNPTQKTLKALTRIQSEIIKEEYSVEFNYFKQHIENSLTSITKQLPLPVQFIEFKLSTLVTNYFKGISASNRLTTFVQKTLSNSVKQFTQKIKQKLIDQNSKKAKKFIESKVQKILELQVSEFTLLQKLITQLLNQFEENYTFIPKSVINQTETQLWKHYCKNTFNKYVHKYICIRQQEKQEIQSIKCKQKINNERNQLLQQQNRDLKHKINCLNGKIDRIKANQQQLRKNISQYEKQTIKKDCFMREKQQQIQHILRQNLSFKNVFEKDSTTSKKDQILSHEKAAQKIISSINKLSGSLISKQTTHQIMLYKQKISNLTEMNRFLRQRVEQLQNSNNMKMMQVQYQALQQRYQKLQAQLIQKVEQKAKQVNVLNIKIESLEQQKLRIVEELLILKSSAKEKGKGFQILEKIINEKDSIIENQRNDMLQRIDKFKQQINKLNRHIILSDQNNAQVLEKYRKQILSLTNKNKQKSCEIQQLSKHINKQEKKLDKISLQKIQMLNQQIAELEQNLERTHEIAKETSKQYDKIIASKQKGLEQNAQIILQLRKQLQVHSIDQLSHLEKCRELQNRVICLQIQKERYLAQINQTKMLVENKQSYYEKSIKKLKSQQKEQQSEFNNMLCQLRHQNNPLKTAENNTEKRKTLKIKQNLERIIRTQLRCTQPKRIVHTKDIKQHRQERHISSKKNRKKENTHPIARSLITQFH